MGERGGWEGGVGGREGAGREGWEGERAQTHLCKVELILGLAVPSWLPTTPG